MNAASELDTDVEELVLGKMKKFSHDPVVLYAAITHVKNLLPPMYAPKITPEMAYKLRLFKKFLEGIDSIYQTKSVPYDLIKDHSFSFLLGEMCLNNRDCAKYAQVLRTRAFYMYVAVGEILDLKVNTITEDHYELLIIHKHSLKFNIVDLNLIAILPKADATMELKEKDYIRAVVKGFVVKETSLHLSVSLKENVREELKHIKLGKIEESKKACNKVSINHKYFSEYLRTIPTFISKFNAGKWQTEMDELGMDPFITCSSDEQCNNSSQINKKYQKKTLPQYKTKLLVNPTAEHAARQLMASTLYKSARSFDKQGNIKKAISCLEAAKVLWVKNNRSFHHSLKKHFSKKLLDAWSKK